MGIRVLEYRDKVIISGHFLILTEGHLQLIEHAARLGDVYVIVNNDDQVRLKGNIPHLDEKFRVHLLSMLKPVKQVFLSIDKDSSVAETLRYIRKEYPNCSLSFLNGGDRTEDNRCSKEDLACKECRIQQVFGGGPKIDSSTRVKEAIFKEMYEKYQKTEGLIAFL